MNDIWLKFLEATGKAFWVEVKTTIPPCTYYFGPFGNVQEAEIACPGYVDDLAAEGAQGIHTDIRQMKPKALTIDHTLGEMNDHEVSSVLRGQLS